MGSNRLPGKVLKKVLGKPLLEYQIERLKRIATKVCLVIATTTLPQDDPIVALCNQLGVATYRGSEEDVLSRYYEAGCETQAEIVVRLTADCPLIDPEIIERAISLFLKHPTYCDYLSNCLNRSYPKGMDVEVMRFSTLKDTWKNAKLPEEREHVTLHIYHHPERYAIANFTCSLGNYASTRLTVDTFEDFVIVSRVIENLYPKNPRFTLEDILHYLHGDG
ncbi:MAG: glycosyltransferase family protein [Chlamydiales bacterium]